MARKRGRPPKIPSSSHKQPQTPSKDSLPIDFKALDDLNLDDLSPKKQGELLTLLEELKNRIQGKPDSDVQNRVDHSNGKGKGPEAPNDVDQLGQTQNKDSTGKSVESPVQSTPKPASVWDNFDISRLRSAGGKLTFHQPVLKEEKHCRRKHLSILNREHFSSIDKKEIDLRQRLNLIQQELIVRPLDPNFHLAERDMIRQYNQVKNAADSFLRQKEKLTWLKDGDANTQIFHQSIKQRMYQNRVLNITSAGGISISDPSLIHKEFQSYYENLYRSLLPSKVAAIAESPFASVAESPFAASGSLVRPSCSLVKGGCWLVFLLHSSQILAIPFPLLIFIFY
ncbi:hypothetical protein RIF29_29808 [Crotalaria pallida]|uniref:Uncharacterized protein n=1 Tax=Crotalaria pallida TaxID=3830 RepID=A0AAN9EHJ7_CROPI